MDMNLYIKAALALALLGWIPWVQSRISSHQTFLDRAGLFIAAFCGAISLQYPAQNSMGIFFGALWPLWCLWNAARVSRQFFLWGSDHLGRFLYGMASIILVGGSFWFFSTRFDAPFLGFQDPWKTLTAIHFHYAGYLLTTLFGVFADQIVQTRKPVTKIVYTVSSLLYLVGFVFVAVGLNGARAAELFGSALLFASVLTNLSLICKVAWDRKDIYLRLLGLTVLTVGIISFTLALLFAFHASTALSLPLMISSHGILNAVVLIPALIFLCKKTVAPLPFRQIPFSRLRSAWKVGPDFFKKYTSLAGEKKGLLDRFEEFDRPEFSSQNVDPRVRDFYEQTTKYDLHVTAEAHSGFKVVWACLAKPFFSSIQQLNLPDREKVVSGTIQSLNEDQDGRAAPRGWTRIDASSGRSIYVAAYSMHKSNEVTYMNISFPLPLSNMTSVLHVEHLERQEKGAIRLTTLRSSNDLGDQGVYLVLRSQGLRLPLNETIDVWFDDALKAQHKMWFCGWNYLSLNYTMNLKT